MVMEARYTSDSFIPVSDDESTGVFQVKNEKRKANSKYASRIPWKKRVYSCSVVGLHEEINDFYEKMSPTEEETEVRLRVVEHITIIIHSLWPHAKVEIFGSFRTGLYLPSSDIDMVVIGEWKGLPLSTLSNALQLHGIAKSDINLIPNATVPIVKLIHTPSKIKVDISFNMKNGVESAKLIKSLIQQYPALPKLVYVLKQFLVQRNLNEVYNGGMSSYCLTLLIVSLLQGCHKPKTLPSSNLGTLLLEFFELYGVNFNYIKVSIHLQNGGTYKPKSGNTGTILSVEDPLVEGNDVAKGTYLINVIRLAFQNAFHTLHKVVMDSTVNQKSLDSYLSLIIAVDDEMWIERERILNNYSRIIQQLSNLSKINISEDSVKNTIKRKKIR